jgi:hypothetical protein
MNQHMLNRKYAVPGLAVAIVLLAGACSDNPPTEPSGIESDGALFGKVTQSSRATAGTLDARLTQIAERVPGFGGIFYGEDGALNVVMAGGGQVQAGTVRQSLAGHLSALGVDVDAQPVRVVRGRYDFAQLNAKHQAVAGLLRIDNVVFTDADEVANRVTIGVADEATASAVMAQIAMLNLPVDAFRTAVVEPIAPMQGLRDVVRPVAGGLQINFPGFLCTLGFNVRSPNRPNVHGFVTNSHCTSNQFQSGTTPYWQPSGSVVGGTNFIGTEAFDAPGFTTGGCPAGRICRNSDAAGVQYATGVDNAFGRIYRTTARNSLTIDASNPMWQIVSERAGNGIVGDEIHKTGRTTGWTWGNISASCTNTNVGGTSFTLFCQDLVTGPTSSVAGGDSGSGVWRRLGTGADNQVELVGILWGGSGSTLFVYSPMTQIRADNPPPAGAANWIVYPGQTAP